MTESEARALCNMALPCPFCGCRLEVFEDDRGYSVVCHPEDDVECFVDDNTNLLLDLDDLRRWNIRDGVEHEIGH